MARTLLTTTGEVIDALGGSAQLARMLGYSVQRVHNWRGFPTFPADTFLALNSALHAKGLTAPPSLWSQVEPPARELREAV
jgi:hypothetical protein